VADGLLRLWFRIAPGARMYVSCECCMRCLVPVSTRGRPLSERSSTKSSVSVCDTETSRMRRPRPNRPV